jgi:hypothetical protein
VGIGRFWKNEAVWQAMATLYAGIGEVDAVVLRRWGWVLDAAWGTHGMNRTLGAVAGRHWPQLMLAQAAADTSSGPLSLRFADLERIAAVDGTPPAALVKMAFSFDRRHHYHPESAHGRLSRLPGFTDAVAAHHDVAESVLVSGSVEEQVAAAVFLGVLGEPAIGALAEPLAEAATCTSAKVREAARPVTARTGDAAIEPLRRLATAGTSDRRVYALELLAARPDQRAWAIQTAGTDRAASVRALSARWAASHTPAATEEDPLPEMPPLPTWSLAAAEAERVATTVFEIALREVESYNRRTGAVIQGSPNPVASHGISEPPRGTVDRLARLLAADGPAGVDDKLDGLPGVAFIASEIGDAIREHEYSAATAIQVMAVLGWLEWPQRGYSWWPEVIDEVHARTGGPDLLTVQRMFDAVGADGRALVWSSYINSWGFRIGRYWPDDDVWPFVAHNLDWIVAESSARRRLGFDEYPDYVAIATLPAPPARLADHLYTLAVSAQKSERAHAQAALARDPLRAARVAAALQDGKGEVRLAAAQWLTRIADPSALPALQAAWENEKQDVIRGALLDALIAIGEDAATYLDPAATAADAARFVAKGLPSSLNWLDWAALPEVSWASSGETVPRAVVQWLCATAVKAKSPEPDAMLRHYAALFDAVARERLGSHLLDCWLREDSPSASRGLLALVAACGGRDVVPAAEQYLKKWYGQRAAQGKALIAMLAWVNHPSATQLVLAIGSGFRTKSFQEEAVRQADALAERNGWTVDELADRTIPTAGFDEHGVLDLPYGPRTFTAVLRPDLTVELRDPDGTMISALPAPRKLDDADQAKESRSGFSAAKKELKTIAALQAQRLYEAMCTGRSWPAEDWDRYLLRHPVAGPGVRRLVWVAEAGDRALVVFRPLDDGSLTDSGDNEVHLPDGSRIKVAHDTLLSPDEVPRWAAHLADYEVTPLFQQLGRGTYAVTPQLRPARQLTDFTGYVLEAFALRGLAGKLGYTRGQAQGGAWFYTYEKRLPTLGIVATVNFTGNPMHEENRPVALKELSFRRETPDGYRGELSLGDVPAVFVSECWQDMRLLAEGATFDPEWEKKTEH